MQALAMADLAREQTLAAPRQAPQRAAARHRWRHAALGAAAAIIGVAGVATVWLAYGQVEFVTPAQVSGAVTWNAEARASRSGLEAGAALRAETLSVEGAASSAQLRFRDGSIVTVAGDSELAFPPGAQKQLALRHGSLTVDVRPQPADRPMIVRTPTAEVEVLGTRFLLVAQSGETQLAVESGRVRLRRLADGSTVDVPRGHVALATLDTAARLLPAGRGQANGVLPQPPAVRTLFCHEAPALILRQQPAVSAARAHVGRGSPRMGPVITPCHVLLLGSTVRTPCREPVSIDPRFLRGCSSCAFMPNFFMI
jgi:ferric-dicitrate binding protein FerR (iron transport regulator)